MRKLNNNELRALTVGAVNIEEAEDGLLHFYKYTKYQMDGFGKWNDKSPVLCTTGVRIDLHTDSSEFAFAAASKGKYEVYVDGLLRLFAPVGYDALDQSYGIGERISVSLCDPLGNKKAEHRVTLYLPSHSIGSIAYIELDDGSYAKRHSFARKFLMIGDSITQGWNSKYDSLSYANIVSRYFDADSIVQGRGGSYYKEDTFEKLDGFDPEVVTIAYGTNDFGHYKTLSEMGEQVSAYLDKVKAAYGDKKVFVISPTWRKNRDGKPMGSFESCRELIIDEAEKRGFIHVDGLSLIPPVEDLFTDGLHPNDLGFSIYSQNLIRIMNEYI